MIASPTWPEETAEELYEDAPCGCFSTLPDGTIIRANRTFLKQTGHTLDALTGHRVQELMTTAGRVFYETHFGPLLRMQGSVKEIACDLCRPDRAPLPVLLNAVLIRDEAGEPVLIRFAVFDATDRRLYESELRRSRKSSEHYAAIVKASADAILSIAADGTVQTWNAGAERLFGYTSAEAVGHAAFELIVPVEDEAAAESIVAELRAGRAVRRETICSGKGGRRVQVSVSLTPHIEPPGELTGVSAILRDISERKHAQETLERYRLLAEGSRDIMVFFRTDGQIVEVNRAAVDAYGYTREELIGTSFFKIRAPETRSEIPSQIERVAAGPIRFETIHVRRDGSRFPVEVSWSLSHVGGERVILSIIRDITERRETEENLRASEEHLADFFETATIGLHWVGPDGTVLRVNKAELNLLGYTREEYLGHHIAEFHASQETIDDILTRLTNGEELHHYEAQLRCKDGSLRDVLIASSVLRDAEGHFIHSRCFTRDITERKAAEKALRESEQRFRETFENVAIGIAHVGLDGRWLRMNPAVSHITGYSSEELAAKTFGDITHPEDLEADLAQVRRVLAGEIATYTMEKRYLRKDGSIVWANLTVSLLRDAAGEPLHFISAIEDISGKKAAAEELARQQRYVEQLTQVMPNVLYVFDLTTQRNVWVNRKVGETIGYSPAEILDMGSEFLQRTIHPADSERMPAHFQKLAASPDGDVIEIEYRFRRRDGHWRWFRSCDTVFTRNADGSVREILGTATDVTAGRHAEEALRESTARLALGVQVAEIALAEVDYATGLNHLSAEAARLFGLGDAAVAVPREKVHATFHPEDQAELLLRIAASLDPAGTGGFAMDHRVVWPDGEVRWLRVRKQVVFEGEGAARRPVRAMLVALDVTTEKTAAEVMREAKENAEAANRAKDRFLAVLSHELRTPLTPVLMTVAALEHEPDLRPDLREDFTMMKRNIELEIKLIDDLLDLNRIISGKLELNLEPIDLNEAVRHACAICRPQLLEQAVRLETALSEDNALITADPARLRQVLWNVLRNAIKFTPENGVIHVSTARLGPDRCEVRVRDSGIGIPAEALAHIFDAFEQGDARITRQFGGLGLGLAISKALIELHGGTIRAESEGDGQGATFLIELPGTSAAPAEAATTADRPDIAAPDRIRLLLVEDHADTARLLARHLGRSGFAVTLAHTVADGLAAAARETFDVIVSDLGLPDGSGCDFIRGVREKRKIPGIAMSGYGMDEDIRRSHEAGFSEHLVKPLEVPLLIEAIRRVTKERGG